MAVGITLLSNASATGNWVAWPGGRGEFRVQATWGGGEVKLQCKGPNGTEQDVGTDVTLDADGGGIFELGAGEIRAAVTTATAVYAVALRIPSPTY